MSDGGKTPNSNLVSASIRPTDSACFAAAENNSTAFDASKGASDAYCGPSSSDTVRPCVQLHRDPTSWLYKDLHLSGCTFSSLSPTSAFVDGVKMGGSNLADSFNPGGNFMPWTVPFDRYSLYADPVREALVSLPCSVKLEQRIYLSNSLVQLLRISKLRTCGPASCDLASLFRSFRPIS